MNIKQKRIVNKRYKKWKKEFYIPMIKESGNKDYKGGAKDFIEQALERVKNFYEKSIFSLEKIKNNPIEYGFKSRQVFNSFAAYFAGTTLEDVEIVASKILNQYLLVSDEVYFAKGFLITELGKDEFERQEAFIKENLFNENFKLI